MQSIGGRQPTLSLGASPAFSLRQDPHRNHRSPAPSPAPNRPAGSAAPPRPPHNATGPIRGRSHARRPKRSPRATTGSHPLPPRASAMPPAACPIAPRTPRLSPQRSAPRAARRVRPTRTASVRGGGRSPKPAGARSRSIFAATTPPPAWPLRRTNTVCRRLVSSPPPNSRGYRLAAGTPGRRLLARCFTDSRCASSAQASARRSAERPVNSCITGRTSRSIHRSPKSAVAVRIALDTVPR